MNRKLITATLSIGLLSACSHTLDSITDTDTNTRAEALSPTQLALKNGFYLQDPVQRLREYRLNNWRAIDEANLIISTGPSRDYLLTLKNRCHGLKTAQLIATNSRSGTLQSGLDAVLIKPYAASIATRCHIDKIYPLSKTKPEAYTPS